MAELLLDIRSLFCEREGRRLFDAFDLQIDAGQCVELTGPNGSGKSTLLRAIAGLFPDYEGLISHGGVEYMGHKMGISGLLTPLDNLRWYQTLGDRPATEVDLPRLLETFGLGSYLEEPCQHLSAGQQRRVALARLELSPHRLWLLDEPLTALDVEGQSLVRKLIERHIDRRGAALCATHQALEVAGARQLELGGAAEAAA